jgi:hypothetical protein
MANGFLQEGAIPQVNMSINGFTFQDVDVLFLKGQFVESTENFWESLWEKSCEIPIMVDRQGIKGNYEMSDCNDTTVYVSLSGSDCEDEPTQKTVAESV